MKLPYLMKRGAPCVVTHMSCRFQLQCDYGRIKRRDKRLYAVISCEGDPMFTTYVQIWFIVWHILSTSQFLCNSLTNCLWYWIQIISNELYVSLICIIYYLTQIWTNGTIFGTIKALALFWSAIYDYLWVLGSCLIQAIYTYYL